MASYPLSPLYYSISVTPSLCLVGQQFPYFLFSLYRLQVEGFLASIFRHISPLKSPCSLYISHFLYTFQRLAYFFSTRQSCTVTALYIAVILIYIFSSGTAASHLNTLHGVFLQAPIVLHRYLFYSLASSTRAFFTSILLLSPRLQTQELYSIVNLITAIYNRRVSLNKGPYIKAVIYNTTKNVATPL